MVQNGVILILESRVLSAVSKFLFLCHCHSGCADLRETLLLGNPKQGDYRGDFDEGSDFKGLNMAKQNWQQSNHIEDYDECLSVDCLNMNSQYTRSSETLLPGGYRSDYDQAQKSTQPHQILTQRLPTISALHKKSLIIGF